MELSIQEQIFDYLRKANKVLIALPQNITADSLGSGLALKLFLEKLKKDVVLVCSSQVPGQLKFLPATSSVKADISSEKSLIITVDSSKKKLDELSYQTEEDKIHIYLKSSGNGFTAEDVSFGSGKFPVDLIVTLDAASLEDLGGLFHSHADLFFETPKINIDHKAGNELFGQLNLVETTATSVGEILAGLLEQFEANLMDEDISTGLLAGIITKTNSFQHAQTTPQAFIKASGLIHGGGRQQEIIKNIYKTKSLPLLKLWGRTLARLKVNADLSLIYSLLQPSDFEKSQSTQEELLPVLKELMENVTGYKLAAILSGQPGGGTRVTIAVHLSISAENLIEHLQPSSKPVAEWGQFRVYDFELENISLSEAEHRLLESAKSLQISS